MTDTYRIDEARMTVDSAANNLRTAFLGLTRALSRLSDEIDRLEITYFGQPTKSIETVGNEILAELDAGPEPERHLAVVPDAPAPWEQPEAPVAAPKRKRRTKAEMDEARAAEQAQVSPAAEPAVIEPAPDAPVSSPAPAAQPQIVGYSLVQVGVDGTGRPVYQNSPIIAGTPEATAFLAAQAVPNPTSSVSAPF